MNPDPIHLSLAHVTDLEVQALTRAVTSGWVTPLGPEVDAFEAEMCTFVGVDHAVALASGTAALQLGLMALGVDRGDDVLVPSLTFAASPFAVVHAGATPVFLDVDEESWNLDPDLLADVLDGMARSGTLPAAVVPVDLLGRPADYERILPLCDHYGVPVLVDAAESLGATYGAQMAGSVGSAAIFSFNGNKIMTTSGGGMLVSSNEALVEKARYWSTQSREPLPWYEHQEIGYNYRMSNILAALGRAQLHRLPQMIERRREIRGLYANAFADVEGIAITGDPPWGTSNCWLTTAVFDLAVYPNGPTQVRQALAAQDIEARHIWKPMHRQPVFSATPSFLTGTADRLFQDVLCLPSGVGLTDVHVQRVVSAVVGCLSKIRA